MSGVDGGYDYNRFDLSEKKSVKKKDCDCKKDPCECDKKDKKSARWQDSDGDGKWYEEGEDVAVSEGNLSQMSQMKKIASQSKPPIKDQPKSSSKGPEGPAEMCAETFTEGRKEGESVKDYVKRIEKKWEGKASKPKWYDPMKDPSFDHDEAEKTRGQSGKVAEGYQRNPEKGEKEHEKKYGRVRGEKTPMPPRGDKRREEFEKWYAKNVREDVDLSIFSDTEIEALMNLYESEDSGLGKYEESLEERFDDMPADDVGWERHKKAMKDN